MNCRKAIPRNFQGGGGVRATSAVQAIATEHLSYDICNVSLQSRSVSLSIKDQIHLSCDITLIEMHRVCSRAVMYALERQGGSRKSDVTSRIFTDE